MEAPIRWSRRHAVRRASAGRPPPHNHCMAPAKLALIDDLRDRFVAHADGALAAPMQAYMKSALPFHGVPAPLRRRLTAEAVAAHACTDSATLGATMALLWRDARWREERYAAVELPRTGRVHRALVDLS